MGVVVQVVQEAEAEEPEEEAEEQQKEAERVEEGAVVERIVHLKTSIPRKVITVMISTRKEEEEEEEEKEKEKVKEEEEEEEKEEEGEEEMGMPGLPSKPCPHCEERFTTQDGFLEHVSSHSSAKCLVCNWKNPVPKERKRIMQHMLRMHGESIPAARG